MDTTDIVVNRSLLPAEWSYLGEGNIEADPLFVDSQEDFRLRPGSAALKTGPWGLDMGAMVPAGAAIQGAPEILTYQTGATLMVGGPGITHYQYSLNSPAGPWSDEIPVGTPIDLTGLEDGQSYTVYALGKNSAGVWQSEPAASPPWSVDRHFSQLVLNEVLAVNDAAQAYQGTFPDLIELYYDGPDALDLSGVHLRKDPNGPTLFTFGAGLFMNPGDTLVMAADKNTAAPGLHLGFTLDRSGD